MESKKKFVAYYRVSTKHQGISHLSFEAQQSRVLSFIARERGQVISGHSDIQSGKKVHRAGLDKAIAECIKNRASLVVAGIDRLSRDGFRVVMQLQDAGVEYIDASSPNDTDMIKEIKFAVSKDELEKISKRIRDALEAKRQRGEPLGNMANLTEEGRRMGPEYIKIYARTNANNVKASLVIKALKNAGWTYQEIADELNKAGFNTRKGSDFHPTQVRRIYLRSMDDDDRKEKK